MIFVVYISHIDRIFLEKKNLNIIISLQLILRHFMINPTQIKYVVINKFETISMFFEVDFRSASHST